MAMVRLEGILLIFVILVSWVRGDIDVDFSTRGGLQDQVKEEKTRGLRRRGFLDNHYPVQRHRKRSNRYYRQGGGKGKGGKGKWGKSAKSKGGKGGRHYYDGYHGYNDGYNNNGYLDDDIVVGYNGYDISFCVPYPHSHSYSSSDSWDWHRTRDRQLRGDGDTEVRLLKGKSRRQWGKGGGKGGGRGGGGGYRGYGPQDYYSNGFGYGFEYGPDGLLRPRCPPGLVYYDQLPDADRPPRPGFSSSSSSDEGPAARPPLTPFPTFPPDSPDGPDTPDTPAPAVAPTPDDSPAETPTPETPATPGPDTPATPGPDTPDTPAPETPAPGPETAAPSSGTASDTAAPTAGMANDGNRVIVEDSFLEYGFFGGTSVREPTQEELDGLYEQTNLFFTDVFSTMYGADFVSFSADNNVMTFNGEGAEYPVTIDFDAVVEFAEGATLPTRDEVFTAMQNSDLNNFIQSYVWNATPVMQSLFYDTQRVRYDARIQG